MTDWITQLQSKRERKYSQGGQDGVIKAIFENIGTTNKFCVEFGFNSTELTGGSGSNTARLILEDGWTGLLLDSENENPEINLHRKHLSCENIGSTLLFGDAPREPDYVSIDVDGDDLWLLKGMLEYGFRPRLISVEYNARFPITESITVKPNSPKWENDACYGASMLALNMVAKEFGYSLIAVESGLDLFFTNLVPHGMSLLDLEPYTDIHVHHVPSSERQKLFVKYPSLKPVEDHPWFRETGQPVSSRP